MDDNLYKAPESEMKPDALVEWSGKKVFFITALPSLIYSVFAVYRWLTKTEDYMIVAAAGIAILCAVWTGSHLALVRGGNWLDCVGYIFIWCVIHAVAGILFSIVFMLVIAIFFRSFL